MPATTKKTNGENLYFDRYLSHLNHITWDMFLKPWACFVSLRKRVFRIPSRTSCAFYVLQENVKTKFVRYLSQLGHFGRKSISKHSGPSARNSEQTSFSRSLARRKMRMKCGRAYEKYVYEGTQNTPTVENTGPTWCGPNATNSDQSKGFSPFGFSWLLTSHQISTTGAFEYTAICRVCFTFRTHETI